MSPSPATPPESETCAVCGKSTANGRGFARVVVGGRAVELCCPMCLKVHQEREVKRAEEERTGDKFLGWDEKW